MKKYFLVFVIIGLLSVSCKSTSRGLSLMRWIEKPPKNKTSKEVDPSRRLFFKKVGGFTEGRDNFEKIKRVLKEGDVIAYRMSRGKALKKIIFGNLNIASYWILDYGHLGILTKVQGRPELCLLSSQSFKGPNVDEDVMTLKDHSFDVYRLNHWDKLDLDRYHKFVRESCKKAGNWFGYDFSGMFGLWNSNLEPNRVKRIGYDYICSTVVAAALFYAGADIKVSGRKGYLDLVTPRQVVMSHGVLKNFID